jgi:hypothetical protein
VTAVAVNLRGIASPFTVGAAIFFAVLDPAITGGVLTRSGLFIVSHLLVSLFFGICYQLIECFYT